LEYILDPETLAQLQALIDETLSFGTSLFRRRQLYQLALLAVCFGAAQIITVILAPRMARWMHTLEGWPKWRLRVLVLVHQRIRLSAFVVITWLVFLTLREVTWHSWSNLLGPIAELATAWLFVSFASRLIHNRTMRRTVRWGAWIFVTLSILGLTGFVSQLFDRFAIDIGEFHLSLLVVIRAGVTLAALLVAARLISSAAATRINQNDDISPSMRVLSVKAVQLALYGVAIFIGLQTVGFDLTSLTVLSGAIGLGLGFGLQKVVSNLVSGVILLLDKSIKPGDVISLGDTFGWISSLGARYVSVLTRNGTEFLIPNEDLITNRVVNWSHSSDLVRLDIRFGVSYDSNPHEVKRICSAAPLTVDRVISTPPPVCHVTGFGDSSIDFVLRFWIRDPTRGLTNVRGNVYLALWDALKSAGFEIPYPRRDITILSEPDPRSTTAQSGAPS